MKMNTKLAEGLAIFFGIAILLMGTAIAASITYFIVTLAFGLR